MKIESWHEGCLKIWMTDGDMQRWGLQFESMTASDRATRAAVAKLLEIARKHENLPMDGAMTVEAVPVDNGCILVITPRRAKPLPSAPLAEIYALDSVDNVLQLGEGLRKENPHDLPAASLYCWGDSYRLILYGTLGNKRTTRHFFSEFAHKVGEGTAAAAFVEEHGVSLAVGNALHRLTGFESP